MKDTVHPRACGERARAAHATCIDSGSSPRLRGTPEPKIVHLA